MHESQLARRMLDAVVARAHDVGAERVRKVCGRIGEIESLSADALAFHFHALARGTVAEDAELAIQVRHIEARCRVCARVYLPDHIVLCPACGSTDGDLLGDIGLVVESLEVDDDG